MLEMLLRCSKAIPCEGVPCEFMEPEVFLGCERSSNPNGMWAVEEELRRGQAIRGPDGFTVTPVVTDAEAIVVLRRVGTGQQTHLQAIRGKKRN